MDSLINDFLVPMGFFSLITLLFFLFVIFLKKVAILSFIMSSWLLFVMNWKICNLMYPMMDFNLINNYYEIFLMNLFFIIFFLFFYLFFLFFLD